MSILLHSDTKVGKSTFGSTAPKPMLLLDAEMAYRFLPIPREHMVFWNPLTGPPPVPDGTWSVCVVIVRDYSVMNLAVQYLVTGQHYFKSIVIDSISEIQKRLKDQIKTGSDDMDQRKWGQLLDHMEMLCRTMRDLTEHPTTPLEAVVLTAMTEQRDGKWRPYVQGQLRTTAPYFFDVIGYLFVAQVANPNDPSQAPLEVRRMLVKPHPQFEAGERVQGRLCDYVDNPTIEGMLASVFDTPAYA
jgi:hypothetical protein